MGGEDESPASRQWDDPSKFPAGQRYLRYSDRRTGQMSLAINVAFAIAVAILGVAGEQTISIAAGELGQVTGVDWLIAAAMLAAASALTGGSLVMTRLLDFRFTARIAALEWSAERMNQGRPALRPHRGKSAQDVLASSDRIRKTTDALGRWSWRLLWVQYGLVLLSLTAYAAFIARGLGG